MKDLIETSRSVFEKIEDDVVEMAAIIANSPKLCSTFKEIFGVDPEDVEFGIVVRMDGSFGWLKYSTPKVTYLIQTKGSLNDELLIVAHPVM